MSAKQVTNIIPKLVAVFEKYFLVKNNFFLVSATNIIRKIINMYINYRYEKELSTISGRYIYRIINTHSRTFRPIQLSDFFRKKLELKYFRRSHFEGLQNKICIFIPLIIFIDAFKAYRNIYRSLISIYNTPVNLFLTKRSRKKNTLTFILGPHGSSFENVVEALKPGLAVLNEGVFIQIKNRQVFICAFTIAYIGNMLQ